ncbi:MAG: hypothetical protein ABIG66_05660 [Candidatus Kerfeldbacteria bacterium]
MDQAVEELRRAGWHKVMPVHITDENRQKFRLDTDDQVVRLSAELNLACTDLLVSDLELGGGITAWKLLLAARAQFPALRIVLLTGADIKGIRERLTAAGIQGARKQALNRAVYARAHARTDSYAEEECRLWSTPETSLQVLSRLAREWTPKGSSRDHRLGQLRHIVLLKDRDEVVYDEEGDFSCSILRPGPLTHMIGHALCDGHLGPEDVAPFLPDLRLVLRRIPEYIERDERFAACARFILSEGPAEELPGIFGLY